MSRLTEQGHAVFANLTERGRHIVGALTDAARLVFGGTTYDKTGGADADWNAGGVANKRKHRRKQLLSYSLPQPRKAVTTVKHGGVQTHALAGGIKQFERIRAGVALATPLADGRKFRVFAPRVGGARSLLRSSGTHTRIYADRSGSGLLSVLSEGFRRAVYAESVGGIGQPRAYGYSAIIRGDDSEDLLLLGFDPEDEELLLLA